MDADPCPATDDRRRITFATLLDLSDRRRSVPAATSGPLHSHHGSSRAGSDRFTSSLRDIPDEDSRLVHVNDPARTDPRLELAGNSIRTGKYSLLSFLPRNLFEQFHRLAYVYFLVIAVLNQLPMLAVFGRTASIIPLVFVLLATAVKDAYEDWRRHRSDRIENNAVVRDPVRDVRRDLRSLRRLAGEPQGRLEQCAFLPEEELLGGRPGGLHLLRPRIGDLLLVPQLGHRLPDHDTHLPLHLDGARPSRPSLLHDKGQEPVRRIVRLQVPVQGAQHQRGFGADQVCFLR